MIYTTIYGKETRESGFQIIMDLKKGDVIIRVQWDEFTKNYQLQSSVCNEDNPMNFDRFSEGPIIRFI